MNLLLDTNVYIDYLGKQAAFFEPAQKIFAAGYFGDVKLWVPAQSLADAFNVLKRYVGADRVQRAMDASLEVVSLVSLTPSDAARALKLGWNDYEDCLISLSALQAKADYIITRDIKGFERSMVPAITPAEWLESMEREHGISYDTVKM